MGGYNNGLKYGSRSVDVGAVVGAKPCVQIVTYIVRPGSRADDQPMTGICAFLYQGHR